MKELNKILSPLDWNLWMSGCFITFSRLKFINFFVRAHGLCLILNQLRMLWNIFETPETLVYAIRRVCDFGFGLICILVVWKNQRKLRTVFQSMLPSLGKQDRKYLKRLTFFLLVYKILRMAIGKYIFKGHEVWELQRDKESPTPAFIYSFVNNLHYWPHICFLLFVVYIQSIRRWEQNVICNVVKKMVSKRHNSIDSTATHARVESIINTKVAFINCISILPCLRFFYLFVDAVATVMWLREEAFDNAHAIYSQINLGHLLVEVAETGFMGFLASNACQESQRNLDNLKAVIILTREDATDWTFTLEEIQENKRFEYHAGHFFAINKPVLMSFVSAFITFTVLFVKLVSS